MRLVLLAISVVALGLVFACGGDDAPSATPDASTPTPTIEPARREEILNVVRSYVTEVGLDGVTGELTNPVECASISEESEGDFCIVEPSVYAPGLALVLVASADDPVNEVWQVRAVRENGDWEVTDTVKFEPE